MQKFCSEGSNVWWIMSRDVQGAYCELATFDSQDSGLTANSQMEKLSFAAHASILAVEEYDLKQY